MKYKKYVCDFNVDKKISKKIRKKNLKVYMLFCFQTYFYDIIFQILCTHFCTVHAPSVIMFEPGRTRPTPWTEISTDFDPEEETANFGTRHALEADGSIYEVRGALIFHPYILSSFNYFSFSSLKGPFKEGQ